MKLKNLQDENQMSHKGARAIKLPKRYSDYECDSYKSEVSILQRDQMNYNEEELFFDSLNTIDKRKQEINKHAIQIDDDSNCICINFIPKSPSTSTSKIKKQNYVYSIEDINRGNATPKIHRTKFSRYTLIGEELKKDNVDKISPKRAYPKDTTQNISLDNTSKKSRIDCKSILTISNKDESMIYKVGKSKIDRIKITGQVDKDLSMKTSQKNNTNNKKNIIKSLVMQNGLNIQRTSFKRNILTPTMKMRTNIPAKSVTLLQEVRTKLHVSAVPKSLPCREEQFNNIYTFVESKLMDKMEDVSI
ncbi:origin recognition complex subunit 1-like [Pogonomyrmex barbatus]|uniref:Origin recognition complex subunit 1 n=1 Tax=Pogonomyrmex barbatus TaxID=144034 RepID=A0A6I9WAI8_9HYME|nr:origin recognition complex subunit 1-like [Pogonomyrmex barbatus]